MVSPNDTHAGVSEKALAWLKAGSRMVLVVNPGEARRNVTVYRSREDIRVLAVEAGDWLGGTGVVPGWTVLVTGLFT